MILEKPVEKLRKEGRINPKIKDFLKKDKKTVINKIIGTERLGERLFSLLSPNVNAGLCNDNIIGRGTRKL